MRQMTLVAFLQAQNCTNFVGSWRHPEASPDFMTADYYRHIARVLEAGKFHVGFFDDRLAMPDRYGGDHAHTVANGIRCVKMDPITILTVMGMATERLGLGATCSTTYYEPFHVARVFQTLDLMTNGRAAWNIVTSMNDGEALNMGHAAHGEHDRRYDRADEFLEVVMGHWDAWDDDAIVLDKQTGTVRASRQGASAGSSGRVFPIARTVHRASVGAGASGADPGRTERTRPAVRRALGGTGVRELPLAGACAGGLCGIQEAGRSRARPGKGGRRGGCLYGRGRDARRSGRQGRADRQSAEGDRPAFFVVRGAERRSCAEADRRAVDQEEIRTWTGAQGMRDRVYRVLGKRNPTTARLHRDHAGAAPSTIIRASSAAPRKSRTAWRNGSPPAPATAIVVAASHVPGGLRGFLAPRLSPNCSAADCSRPTISGATLRGEPGA